MKKAALFLAILFVGFVTNDTQSEFQQLSALTGGIWVMKTKKGVLLCERWKKINSNKYSSQGFKVSGNDTTWLEQVELVRTGNTINYVSLVKDQNEGKAVPFRLIEAANNQFVFSNPEHDYPQRIIYHFVSQDSLHAWIDGKNNGKDARSDFYYSRRK